MKLKRNIYYGPELAVPLIIPAISPLINYYANSLYRAFVNAFTAYDTFMQGLMQSTIDTLQKLEASDGVWLIEALQKLFTLLFQLMIGIAKYVAIFMGRAILSNGTKRALQNTTDLANATIENIILCAVFGVLICAMLYAAKIGTGMFNEIIRKKETDANHIINISRTQMYIVASILVFPFSILNLFPIVFYEVVRALAAGTVKRKSHIQAAIEENTLEEQVQHVQQQVRETQQVRTSAEDRPIPKPAKENKPARENKPVQRADTPMNLDDFIGREKEAEIIRSTVNKQKMYFSKQNELKQQYPNAPVIKRPLLKIPAFHIIITGNPGTGKTEFARAIARYMSGAGVISNGNMVEISRQEIVGAHIGDSAKNLLHYIEKAQGGILFIDEAYSLMGDSTDNNLDVINVLLKELDRPDCNFILIMAGYKYEMTQFLNKNDGLKRRIKIELDFPDFNEDQLFKIFTKYAEGKFVFTKDALDMVRSKIHTMYLKRDSRFGNAAAMRDLLNEEIVNNLYRNNKKRNADGTIPVSAEDILTKEELDRRNMKLDDIMKGLNQLVGLESLKTQIKKIYDSISFDQLKMETPNSGPIEPESYHFLFVGEPGTGKTTAARKLGEIFYQLGILSTPKVVEVKRDDLVGQFVGASEAKTRAKLEEARGGILFVDEAHQLYSPNDSQNDYGKRVLNTFTADMENNRYNYILIMAGYEDKIRDMLSCDKGLESRFKYTVQFPDYTDDEMIEIFKRMCKNGNYVLSEKAKEVLPSKIAELRKKEGFANARSVRNYYSEVKSRQNGRIIEIKNRDGIDAAKKKMNKIEKVDM